MYLINSFIQAIGHLVLTIEPVTYPGFYGMKHFGVLPLPCGWDAIPLEGYTPTRLPWYYQYPFILLGEDCEALWEFNVLPKTQYSDAARSWAQHFDQESSTLATTV